MVCGRVLGGESVTFRFRSLFLIVCVWLGACAQGAKATPSIASEDQSQFGQDVDVEEVPRERRSVGPFAVPAGLRGRVDFWKDVFAKYSSKQVVVHHREFPQIVFGVIDLEAETRDMGPIEFERHKDSVVKRTVLAVQQAVEALARGEAPSSDFQTKVVHLMSEVPGGAGKYRRIVEEDLIRTQTGIRDRYVEAVRRSRRYLPMMEHIFVNEYGLPKELTRLPFVESSFDYTAYSSVGAAGIWQFMPRTAKAHQMKVGKVVDERRDPLKATHAAAQYLRSAYQSLGSWPLAITSYNHGVGGVRSKVRKAGTSDIVEIIEHPGERFFGFASSNFYPEFLAAVEIYEDWRTYFPEVKEEPPLRLVSFPLAAPASPQHISHVLNIPLDELREANYALLDPVWRGAAKIPAGYTLRLPAHYEDRTGRILPPESRSRAVKVIPVMYSPPVSRGKGSYVVKRGDTLGEISRKTNRSVEALRRANKLKGNSIKAGQRLVVP
jgi:membrane-bound lytic murein transglycosylase D